MDHNDWRRDSIWQAVGTIVSVVAVLLAVLVLPNEVRALGIIIVLLGTVLCLLLFFKRPFGASHQSSSQPPLADKLSQPDRIDGPQRRKTLPRGDIQRQTLKTRERTNKGKGQTPLRIPIIKVTGGTMMVLWASVILLFVIFASFPTPQRSSTSSTLETQTAQATHIPSYVSGLNSTNASIFLNSFSLALRYQDVQNIEKHTDIINFTVKCTPNAIIVAGNCNPSWKEIKSWLSTDKLEFEFFQNAPQNPPLTGPCAQHELVGGDLSVEGSVHNKGSGLPISHLPSAVFNFGRPANGSESPLEWESVCID